MTQAQQLADLSQAYTAGCLGFRNRMINGACDSAQRGASSTWATTAGTSVGGYGGPDRFYAQNSAGGSFSQGQNTLTAVNKASIMQAVVAVPTSFAGPNQWSGIRQSIEGTNCYDLWTIPMAASFLFVATLTGNYSFYLADANYGYSFLTTFNYAGGIQRVVIPIPGSPSAASFPRTTGTGLTYAIGALNRGTYQGAANPNAWQTGALITASNAIDWSGTIGNYICATDVQLEIGTIATPFERRPYGMEFALCQRYWEQGQVSVMQCSTASGIYVGGQTKFSVQKRIAPNVVLTRLFTSGNIAAVSNPSGITYESFLCYASTTGTGGVQAQDGWTANAEL